METDVYTREGSLAGRSVELEPSVFGIDPNDHVIWLDVRRLQASQRQGTHKTKERNEVAGSRRKLYRQKGTGNARAGDAKSPIRRTGGRAHGVRPRSYDLNLNRKTKRLARRSALAYKAQDEAVRVVEDFSLEEPETRSLVDLAESVEADDRKVLFLTTENEPAIYKSSQNLPDFEVQEARNATTFDILNADVVVFQEGGLEMLSEQLGDAEPAAA
ncbi:MAG: 50S ribosomal protein L4 [Bacteroidetes bacterium QS_8_64_10]|jgi:large subunit ribosomal protein L4|nr:MAG: 50S ribosomal protein L4 [Bacteroidetes bacterium QS_8_64_10]